MISRRAVAAPGLLLVLLTSGCTGAVAPATVTIRDLRFSPDSLEIRVGNSVEWRFDDDGLYHHVEAEDGSFESDIVGSGTFTATFNESGSYPYSCSIHPYMTGTVVVTR